LFFVLPSFNLNARRKNPKDAPMKLLRPLRIFLLHARSDEKVVARLYKRLLRTGASVWLDQKNLLPGEDWQSEIRRAIQISDIVLVCLSKRFNKQGGYRHEELRIALEKANLFPQTGIYIIPVRLEECETPEPLRCWQRVDLFEEDGYEKLLAALREHIVDPAFLA
jgi:hypothetical protein